MEASDSFLIPVGDSIAGISIGNERKNSIIVTCKNTGIKVYEVISFTSKNKKNTKLNYDSPSGV